MKKLLLSFLLSTVFAYAQNSDSTFTKRGVEAASNKNPQASGNVWALIVGISDYKFLPKLQFAHRDAEIFAGYLIGEQKVPADNVRLYLNERATANNVISEFKQILEKVKTGDKVYLYFAGHGDNETVKGKEFSVLLLHGIKERDYVLGNDYIEMQLINQWITDLRLKGANTIFIADACHSGANLLVGGIPGTQSTQQALKDVVKAETKILSCGVGELSLEGKQWGDGRGNFSYHLINGLMGDADKDNDNRIKYNELESYLKEKVNEQAKPSDQTPEMQAIKSSVILNVNKEHLTDFMKKQKANFPLFSSINTKGSEEFILNTLDSSVRIIYQKFENCLKAKKLVRPLNDCAEFYLQEFPDKKGDNEQIASIMTRNLTAVLQEDGNRLLEICFKIGALGGETSQSLVTKDSLILMIQYFDKTIELLKGNYLEKRIEARKDFLEMLLITYDKGSLQEGKKISLAISKLKKSLEKEPDVFYTLTALGHLYGTRQILDSCIYYYKKCLDLDPHFLVANDIIANQYFIKGDMKNARKYFEYHNTERPNSSFGYEGIAKTYQVEGDKTKAFDFFNQAYEKDKANAQIMKGILENSLSNEVGQKKFRRFLTEINNLNTDNKQKDFKRFELYWAMRDTTKAREIAYKYIFANKINLNDTTRRKTNDLSFSENSFFSDFFRAVKDCKGFEAIMKNSSIDNPKDANSFQLLGRNYLLYCNEPEKAEKAFLKSYQLDSLNFSTLFGLSDFYSQQIDIGKRRDLDKAIYFGEKALKIYDSEFLIYNALAPLYSEKSDFKKAIYFYKKAISLGKNVKNGVYDIQKLLSQHYSLLSDCYEQLSMLDSAIYFVKEGLNLNPKDIMLYQTLASYHFNQKAYQEAFNVVKYAYDKIDSTNKTLLGSLGLYCYVLDRFKESNYYYSQMEKYLDKGFRLPNGIMIDNVSPIYLTFMSNNYAYLNNLSKAEELAKQYIQQNPEEIGGYSALALAYRKAGKTEEAKTLSDKMFSINNKDFRGYSNLSKIYTKTQDIIKALEYFEKALQNGMTRPIDFDRLTKTDNEWAELRLNSTFQSLINTYFKKK